LVSDGGSATETAAKRRAANICAPVAVRNLDDIE
jgi:hypothetical protein